MMKADVYFFCDENGLGGVITSEGKHASDRRSFSGTELEGAEGCL